MSEENEQEENNEFAEAKAIMAKHIINDHYLYLVYQTNIALLLHTYCGIVDYETRNKAADKILGSIFGIRK